MNPHRTSGTLVALIAFVGSFSSPASAQQLPSACDHACLSQVMERFVAAMIAGQVASVPLSEGAEIRENTTPVTLDAIAWSRVKVIRSSMTFADAVTGNVVLRAGVELADGKPGYISTRLKVVAGGRVSDVEVSADTSTRVASAYVWNLDPAYARGLAPEQRMSRIALEALARALPQRAHAVADVRVGDLQGRRRPHRADRQHRLDNAGRDDSWLRSLNAGRQAVTSAGCATTDDP
jgi:hypothetical protein